MDSDHITSTAKMTANAAVKNVRDHGTPSSAPAALAHVVITRAPGRTKILHEGGADQLRPQDPKDPQDQCRRKPASLDDLPALVQPVITSVQDFCQCSAICIQNCIGFVAPIWKASGHPEPAAGFSFCNIADGEAVVAFGNLSCSSQASMMRSIILICISVRLCICVRAASTICSGHPSSAAAAAIFSMTRLIFFSLLSAISPRHVDMASKAALTASRALYESPGTDMGSKLRVASADLLCVAMDGSPLVTRSHEPPAKPDGIHAPFFQDNAHGRLAFGRMSQTGVVDFVGSIRTTCQRWRATGAA